MPYAPIPGTLVIGLTGHARHGKDTAAAIIAGITPGAMAFAISDLIAVHARVSHGMTTRCPATLQQVGYAARQDRPRVWLDALYGAIDDRKPPLALIAGVRFDDEADLVRAMGGFVIRVCRSNADGSPFTAGDRDASFPTETAIAGIRHDYRVGNVSGDERLFRDDVLHVYFAIQARLRG